MGERVPQAVQNLVIRDYCKKNGYEFLLSSTEYAMPECHLILEQTLETITDIAGIAMYSIFQLPEENDYRREIFERVVGLKKQIHFSCEGLKISNEFEIEQLNEIWMIKKSLSNCLSTNEVNEIFKGKTT
mgnify:CR=1 FL=1